MDNAPIHKKPNQYINNIVFLPKYSPFLNPIENTFSVLKSKIKIKLNDIVDRCDVTAARRAQTTVANYRTTMLVNILNESVDCITPELCAAEYQHSNEYLRKSLQREKINN